MSWTSSAQQVAGWRTHELGEDVTLRRRADVTAAPQVVRAEFPSMSVEQRFAVGEGINRVRIAELALDGFVLDGGTTVQRSGGNQLPVMSSPEPSTVRRRGALYVEFYLGGG